MTHPGDHGRTRSVTVSLGELTGALGDAATVVPVVVAIGALTDLSLAHLLLGFAVFQAVWGIYYGLPVSVEPMKALAALVIAGALSAGELAVAGIVAGAVLLTVGRAGTLGRVERYVGRPVVRGVQLAVALILLETGARLSLDGAVLALLAAVVAAGVVVAGHRRLSALVVLGVGVALAVARTGVPTPAIPTVAVALPSLTSVTLPAVEAVVAQLAMTVGNAAIATSLLLSDYYDADVSADDLATSMGVMNLCAVPLGAMPMCHGSGGVAGKYTFGARTAGSNLILGGMYAVAALVAVDVVAAFPVPILGVVLVMIAVELGRAGLDTRRIPLTVGVGLLGVATNVGLAFLVGTVAHVVFRRLGQAEPPSE